MGPSSSMSTTLRTNEFDLKWTGRFNEGDVESIRLWASPRGIDRNNSDVIKGNQNLLKILTICNQKKLLTLADQLSIFKDSTLPQDRRVGRNFYQLSILLLLRGGTLKLIAKYKGDQLNMIKDYAQIVPEELRFQNDSDYISKDLKLKEGLKWKQVKQLIEELQTNHRPRNIGPIVDINEQGTIETQENSGPQPTASNRQVLQAQPPANNFRFRSWLGL